MVIMVLLLNKPIQMLYYFVYIHAPKFLDWNLYQREKTNKKTVQSQGEPRDAAVNVDTIEFYNGIVRFLCHSTAFSHRPTSATA